MNTVKSIIVLALASVSLSSCVVSDYPGGPVVGSVSSSFGVYDALPRTYVGDAYYYRNRYYYGGNYERGRYNYQGRQYTDRYNHGGQYYYGGRNEHHGNAGQQPTRKYNHGDDHGDDRGARGRADGRGAVVV